MHLSIELMVEELEYVARSEVEARSCETDDRETDRPPVHL